jgi:hypothetical protein
MVEKDWMENKNDTFLLKAKNQIIQNGLESTVEI